MNKTQIARKNTKIIEKCLANKAWGEARDRIRDELISEPTDHWLWFSLCLTYYEDKIYDKAVQCGSRAIELQPGCPLALWHYAGSLFMNHSEHLAFVLWIRLLDMDIEDIAYGDHGEGMDWALQLVNDVHFKLAKYYQWAGQPHLAIESANKYLHNRQHGVQSLYDVQAAEAVLQNPSSREAS